MGSAKKMSQRRTGWMQFEWSHTQPGNPKNAGQTRLPYSHHYGIVPPWFLFNFIVTKTPVD